MMTEAQKKEFRRLAEEATEIIAVARGLLSQIKGTPALLLIQRIDHWRRDLALAKIGEKNGESVND